MNEYQILKRILNGYVPFSFGNLGIFGIVRDPTVWEEADFRDEYQRLYQEGIDGGALTEKQALQAAEKRGEWQEDWDIKLIEEHLATLKKEISQCEFFIKRKIELEEKYEELEKEKNRLTEIWNRIMSRGTAHHYAITNLVIFKMETLVQETQGRITNQNLYFHLYEKYADLDIPVKTLRKIARGHAWLTLVKAAKENMGHIFNDLTNLTIHQFNLLSWYNVYSYAFNCLDRPSEEIIENDEAFDEWLKNDSEKQKREESEKRLGDVKGQEVLVMSDREGAKKVYALNDKGVRKKLNEKLNTIGDSKEGISEFETLKKTDGFGLVNVRSKNGGS